MSFIYSVLVRMCLVPRNRILVNNSFGNEEIQLSHITMWWRIIPGLLQRVNISSRSQAHSISPLYYHHQCVAFCTLGLLPDGEKMTPNPIVTYDDISHRGKKRCREENSCTPRDFPLCLTIQKRWICLTLDQSLAIRNGMSNIHVDYI